MSSLTDILSNLDKAFENRTRLGIMIVLISNNTLDFSTLREILDVTDGNLATHLKVLETQGYIGVHKRFVHRRPNTRYSATKMGQQALRRHLRAVDAVTTLVGLR